MVWYWQLWLLAAFGFVAVIWKLVYLNIKHRTEYIFIRVEDTTSGQALPGLSIYVTGHYAPELINYLNENGLKATCEFFELKLLGRTDENGLLQYKNRWLNIQYIVIPERKVLRKYKEGMFEMEKFGENAFRMDI